MADLKRKDYFTYVVTYTFAGVNQVVADQFKNYLQSSIQDDGLEAINIDQSTYATKRKISTLSLLRKLKAKLDELYQQNQLKHHQDDVVDLLCSSHKAYNNPKYTEEMYQFDVFDFEK